MRHLNRPFPWRLCTAQWHVYIPRQRMPEDVGRLTPHVTSLPLVLSFSLPQLPPPAPPWKPLLTERSLAQSILLDMRYISLVPRATISSVQPHVFAGTTAPGRASVPSVKVSHIVMLPNLSLYLKVYRANYSKARPVNLSHIHIFTHVGDRVLVTYESREAERDISPETKLSSAHTQITGKEKSHSLWWLELLGILNEALVKMALNVFEHRKTPVLHSIVGYFPHQLSTPHEQQRSGYCKITPPHSCSCFPASLTVVPLDEVRSRHYTQTMVW